MSGQDIGQQLGGEIGGELGSAAGGYIGEEVAGSFGEKIGSEVGQHLGNIAGSDVGGWVESEVKHHLYKIDFFHIKIYKDTAIIYSNIVKLKMFQFLLMDNWCGSLYFWRTTNICYNHQGKFKYLKNKY